LSSPPGEGLTSPPGPLQIPASRASEYFDAAFRVWVGEIRRIWRAGMSAPASCADGTSADDSVLLAELQLPLVLQENDHWVVDESARIEVRQERRPYLLHLRLLQEWVVSRETAAAGVQRVAAAGILHGDVNNASHRHPLINGLRVTNVADGELQITFNGYAPPAPQGPFQFVVKAQSHARQSPGPPAIVSVADFGPGGITLRVADGQGNALTAVELGSLEISVEVTRYAS
jgi:hypothetical protein